MSHFKSNLNNLLKKSMEMTTKHSIPEDMILESSYFDLFESPKFTKTNKRYFGKHHNSEDLRKWSNSSQFQSKWLLDILTQECLK